MSSISLREVRRQLKNDLIGKDSHRGVTLTYSWLANQFGHFSLGFIPTFILFLRLKTPGSEKQSAIMAAVYVSLFWLAFEIFNFLFPLLSKVSYTLQKKYFKPAWKNIGFDTFTDLLFFWFGASVAGLTLSFFQTELWISTFLLLASIVAAGYYWFVTKIYLQTAQFPFQMRLSQFNKEISDENVDKVLQFRNKTDFGNHLLVFGAANTGKSSLSIGLATEFSIAHGKCYYTTVMKLFSMFFKPDDDDSRENLWTWRSASLLIIDDINAGDPVQPDIVTADKFLRFLRTDMIKGSENLKKVNIDAFKEKNVIWVLGNEPDSISRQQKWDALFRELEVDDCKITVVNLTKPVEVKMPRTMPEPSLSYQGRI